MERKEFLAFKSTQKAAAPANTMQVKRRTSTGLTKYSGTWGKSEVKHLLSRTLFGFKKADMDAFLSKGLDTALTDILNVSATPPSPPVNNYAAADPGVALGATWINAAPDPLYNGPRRLSFKSWWLGLMINQDKTILEKLTVFLLLTGSYFLNNNNNQYCT